ncbi:MAG: hypothetical protein H0U56_15915 [Methylibium sp.]|nr:hypothetical protein [Methylibium sp.]
MATGSHDVSMFTKGDDAKGSAEAGSAIPFTVKKYASFVFLLDEQGRVRPLPHELYVTISRAEAVAEGLAGQLLRLVDWYVEVQDGKPERLVNEWYGWVRFDAQGRFDPGADAPGREHLQQSPQTSALPTALERRQIDALVFSSG